jgi:hypothetical protein
MLRVWLALQYGWFLKQQQATATSRAAVLLVSRTIRNACRCSRILSQGKIMGRNLFILSATLLVLALVSCGVSLTNIAQQPGSPGDVSLWRTMGLVLFVVALFVALAGIFSALFEQAERRADEERRRRRQG